MYIQRHLSHILRKAMGQFPAVLVTGPRQAGKTTLLQHEAGGEFDYVSFDDNMERSFALSDPNGFFNRFGDKSVILDEIQYVPELLSSLKLRIDKELHRNGRWLLTGSQQFHLMHNVSESLAGRIAILDQLPFNIGEQSVTRNLTLEKIFWNGGYPEPALYPEKRDLWLRAYIQTYLECDVRQIQISVTCALLNSLLYLRVPAIHRSLTAPGFRVKSVRLSPTAKSWLGLLEASYFLYLLPLFLII